MVLVVEEGMLGGEAVDGWQLTAWGETAPQHLPTSYASYTPPLQSSPFPVDRDLNNKIVFWEGDISQLRVDAIVHSTDETFSDTNPLSNRIFAKAGPLLKQEIFQEIKECRTGEVVVSKGYRLPAKLIIHTVGPKYNPRFQSAAENTLHNCYRNVLQKAFELKLRSLAICVINSVRRNYPPNEGAHVALRTIRRVLEKEGGRGRLERVILTTERGSGDAGVYEVLLPLYFPRTEREEEAALLQLPSPSDRLFGPLGEPVFPDRQIRIIDNPHHHIHEEDCSVIDLGSGSGFEMTGDTSFTHMQGDLDEERLLGGRTLPHAPTIHPFIAKEIHNQER